MRSITVQELDSALKENKDIVLVDVREEYEYNIGHIPCVNIPMSVIQERVNELNPSQEIYVMCKSGKRAASVANFLEKNHKFNNIGVVSGGIEAYSNEIDNSIEVYG